MFLIQMNLKKSLFDLMMKENEKKMKRKLLRNNFLKSENKSLKIKDLKALSKKAKFQNLLKSMLILKRKIFQALLIRQSNKNHSKCFQMLLPQ